jgi:hypothetical protein
MRRVLPIVPLLCTVVACSQHPTAPSGEGDRVSAVGSAATDDGAASAALRSLAGRATNVLTGAGAAGVAIQITGVADLASDANGDFALESEAPDGRYRVTVSGANVVERQTSLVFPGGTALLSLIPTSFNLRAFDEMVRHFGEAGVLKRWAQAPALVIETSLLDPDASLDASGLPREVIVASAEQQSETAINEVVGQLTRALPLLTGGQVAAFSSVSRHTTAAGEEVPFDTASNVITAVRYRGTGACHGFTSIAYAEEYAVVAARMLLQVCTSPLAGAVVSHELGHALGYGHVSGTSSVMTATVVSDITAFDRETATIAYVRPPGNRAPDADPDTFIVNQSRRGSASMRVTIVPFVP